MIVGVGGIGAETARLCSAFGMRVLGVDARRDDPPPGMEELHAPPALDRLLSEADIVIMTVPHTPATEGMIDARRLGLMRRSAMLITIGRGMTVKLDDLNRGLREGMIGGEGLDVFESEPLPVEHPLWTAPNVLLTPHTAGEGPYLDVRWLDIIIDNARRFAHGEPLRNVADKEQWF